MRVRVLGPVDLVAGGESRPVNGLRRKAVLAVLALHRGAIVSSDQLIDMVWAGDPPATARNTVQSHVSYLRQVLGRRDAIVARPPGYVLDPVLVDTDVAAAERLIEEALQAAGRVREQRLRAALALWRGRPLADADGVPWLREEAERLEQLRLRASRALAEARLALGEHAQLLPELAALTAEHPFDEQAHAQLMLALYRSGRQADALGVYRHLRAALTGELGIEPGPPLRDLESAILRQDRALDLAPEPAPAIAPQAARPAPPDTAPLLEREAPLALLAGYAAQAAQGDGRLALIGGEAGVGKSALVERLQRDLPEARWSWSMCDGLFTPQPLGPLFDLADQVGGEPLKRCAAESREEMFRALLREVATAEVLDVVVVEDIHWADEATLDLLRYLSRRLRGAAVLVLATYRDDGLTAADPLRVALGDLGAQRGTRRIELAPLSPDAVRELAAGSELPPAELHRLTGGNPFYVTEVLRAGLGEVPPSARDAVLARAARLSGGSREILDVAALTGARVEARLLGSVTGCGPSALDELLGSGLLAGDGGWLRFRHEIARLAVAQAVPVHRVQAIHERVLAALQSLGCEDGARLAFHAEAAGDGAAVLRYAPAAARRAARLGSHREAAAQFERALRFSSGADPVTLAGLYEGLADEVLLLDRWPEAEQAGRHALALWREAGDRLREGDALRRLARIRQALCRGPEALATVQEAISVLESLGPSAELARAYAAYAGHRMLCQDYDAAISLALRAQALAIRFSVPDVRSDALNTQAVSASAKDLDWAGQLRQALDLALAGGHHEQAARAYTNLCHIHACKREPAEAERYLAEGLIYCEDHDIVRYATGLRGERVNLLERTGRWAEATVLSTEILGLAGLSPVNRLRELIRLGTLRARQGKPGAWECLDDAAAIAAEARETQILRHARLARAEAHWLDGRPDAARREAELAIGTGATGDEWLRGAVAVWLHRTGSPRLIRGQLAEPYRLLLDGDTAGAAQAWTRLGCPYEAAMALADAPDEASLRAALAILDGLGAYPTARIIRQRLRSPAAIPARVRALHSA